MGLETLNQQAIKRIVQDARKASLRRRQKCNPFLHGLCRCFSVQKWVSIEPMSIVDLLGFKSELRETNKERLTRQISTTQAQKDISSITNIFLLSCIVFQCQAQFTTTKHGH